MKFLIESNSVPVDFDVIPFPLPSLDVDYIFITKLSETLLYVYIYNRSAGEQLSWLSRAQLRMFDTPSRNSRMKIVISKRCRWIYV